MPTGSFDINELKRRMQGATQSLKHELGGLRTGRAAASMLEPVQVEAYGSHMPLNAPVLLDDRSIALVREWILAGASLAWGILGLLLGYLVYAKRVGVAETSQKMGGGWPHKVLLNKYYVDEAYEGAFIRPGYWLSRTVLWKSVDAGLIDGLLVNGSALAVAVLGSVLRLFQNGMIRFYAWSFTIGVTVFVLYLSFSG